jgi:outer membrane protein OmpA-like peptidoglycan-associated protein
MKSNFVVKLLSVPHTRLRAVAMAAVVWCIGISGAAQVSLDLSKPIQVGVFGSAGPNMQPNGGFTALAGFPRPATPFGAGVGDQIMFGGEVSAPLTNLLGSGFGEPGAYWGGARFGFDVFNTTMKASEPTTILQDGKPVQGSFETTLAARFASYGIEPFIEHYLSALPRVHIRVGAKISRLYTSTFTQLERFQGANGVTYVGGDVSRTVYQDLIPNTNATQIAATAGVAYSVSLGKRFAFVPEVSYQFPLTKLVNDQAWSAHFVRIGASLQVTIPTSKRVIRDTVLERDTIIKIDGDITEEKVELIRNAVQKRDEETEDTRYEHITLTEKYINRIPKTQPTKVAKIELFINRYNPDSTVSRLDALRCQETVWNNFQPILNYVFFDSASASLAGKYKQLTKSDASRFALRSDKTQMETYYEVLNIVGSRMKAEPKMGLELVGCVSELEQSKVPNARQLALNRAENVSRYLQEAWGIEPSRLNVRGGTVPAKASKERTIEGSQENQRVEINSVNGDITAPLMFRDTVLEVPITRLRLGVSIEQGVPIQSWQISAEQEGKSIFSFRGQGRPEKTIDVDLDPKLLRRLARVAESKMTFTLSVEQKGQGTIRTRAYIPVYLETMSNLSTGRRKEVDKYTMILFDFGKDDVSGSNLQLIRLVRSRIDSSATVSIVGSSDLSGNAEYNAELAERRAKKVMEALAVPNAEMKGVISGMTNELNATPEGRFHGRTVRVQVQRAMDQDGEQK